MPTKASGNGAVVAVPSSYVFEILFSVASLGSIL